MASCKVALSNNHMMSSSERTATTVPPGNRNSAAGVSLLARNTGSARQVAPYVKSRAIALIVAETVFLAVLVLVIVVWKF